MNVKKYGKQILFVLMTSAAVVFAGVNVVLSRQLSVQQTAARWSKEKDYAHISCFFSEDAGVAKDYVIQIEQQLKTALQEASEDITDTVGRTLVDCYSTQGELTVFSERASVTVRAFGVGGDFFTFHSLELLSGNYFDSSDLNDDGVILDENTAWQLFGSSHVCGMFVEINGIQYPIRGVIKSDSGYFSKAAGEDETTIYVSYGILEKQQEESLPIDCYEILIKNPVEKFGFKALNNALGMAESEYEIVENSSRFEIANRFEVLRNFGIRSMNKKKIVFPYWENRAKAYEDVSALLLILEIVCLIYPFFLTVKGFLWLWKQKCRIKELIYFFQKLLFHK